VLTFIYFGITYTLAWLLAPATFRMLAQGRLLQPNYLQEQIPTGAGILLLLATVPSLMLITILRSIGLVASVWSGWSTQRLEWAVIITVLGFSCLGLLDDTIGTKATRGLRGHIKALMEGQLTTGMVKALYGSFLSIVIAIVAPLAAPLLLCALLISLAANTINLLDLRPGRALKAFFVGYGCITLLSGSSGGPLLCVVATAVVLLPWDLQAKVMLGDTGANVLGAILGLFAVTQLSAPMQVLGLLSLIALHAYTERRSLTTLINDVPLLKWFDNLGRRK
jgi:UDP-GlcNAc:undecaprenyl-phosphate GlcNAc-1-phosphate transferase